MLRALGAHAFELDAADVPSIRRTFERWAQHVLVGAPIGERDWEATEAIRRDWPGMRQFVTAHRRREMEHVVKTVTDLRKAVWAFIGAFARAVAEDGQSDATSGCRLESFGAALDSQRRRPPRREAMSADRVALREAALEAPDRAPSRPARRSRATTSGTWRVSCRRPSVKGRSTR